jgi:thiol-disulfide isomerase/thioredoxin
MRSLPLFCLLLAAAASSAAETAPATVDAALARAQKAHTPVLLDFSAPWCYSCYFMATHVLNGKEWEALEKKTVVAAVDADSPDGAAWMKKLQVKALPAYVVLNEHGVELGRILAEQPRATFYPNLDKILAGASTLDELKRKAAKGSLDATTTVLGAYEARGDGQEGLDWYAGLPQKLRDLAAADKTVSLWRDRLELDRAAKAKDDAATVKAAQRVLAGDIGCDRPYVVDQLLEASEKLPKADRTLLLAQQKAPLDQLLWKNVFVAKPDCADQRSAVVTTADLDAAIDDGASETALLNRAIETVRSQLGDDLKKDRNAADNLRVYLTRAKRTDELDALYPKLIAAYPDDYVYPYRYGKSLVERDQPSKALPLLEQAADKAYGENRLSVAMVRVKALKALKRQADAEQVVADVLEQNGKWFPEQVEKLKVALKS